MASVNKVILLGHLGQDPEVRYTTAGKAVATLRVATSESWKDAQGQKQERTEWTTVVFWDRLAEVAQTYLAKGSQVYVEGSLRTRKYQDRDGNDRYATEVQGRELTMLSGKREGGQREERRPQREDRRPQQQPTFDDLNDDIPF